MTINSERESYLTKITQLVRDLNLSGSRDRAFKHYTFLGRLTTRGGKGGL